MFFPSMRLSLDKIRLVADNGLKKRAVWILDSESRRRGFSWDVHSFVAHT